MCLAAGCRGRAAGARPAGPGAGCGGQARLAARGNAHTGRGSAFSVRQRAGGAGGVPGRRSTGGGFARRTILADSRWSGVDRSGDRAANRACDRRGPTAGARRAGAGIRARPGAGVRGRRTGVAIRGRRPHVAQPDSAPSGLATRRPGQRPGRGPGEPGPGRGRGDNRRLGLPGRRTFVAGLERELAGLSGGADCGRAGSWARLACGAGRRRGRQGRGMGPWLPPGLAAHSGS